MLLSFYNYANWLRVHLLWQILMKKKTAKNNNEMNNFTIYTRGGWQSLLMKYNFFLLISSSWIFTCDVSDISDIIWRVCLQWDELKFILLFRQHIYLPFKFKYKIEHHLHKVSYVRTFGNHCFYISKIRFQEKRILSKLHL